MFGAERVARKGLGVGAAVSLALAARDRWRLQQRGGATASSSGGERQAQC